MIPSTERPANNPLPLTPSTNINRTPESLSTGFRAPGNTNAVQPTVEATPRISSTVFPEKNPFDEEVSAASAADAAAKARHDEMEKRKAGFLSEQQRLTTICDGWDAHLKFVNGKGKAHVARVSDLTKQALTASKVQSLRAWVDVTLSARDSLYLSEAAKDHARLIEIELGSANKALSDFAAKGLNGIGADLIERADREAQPARAQAAAALAQEEGRPLPAGPWPEQPDTRAALFCSLGAYPTCLRATVIRPSV